MADIDWYNKTIKYEKTLKKLKLVDITPSIKQQLKTLQLLYENGLKYDIDLAISKEIEQNLWKLVYYKIIELRRNELRHIESEINIMEEKINIKNRKGNSTYKHLIESLKVSRKNFIDEIEDMSSFYESLLTDLLAIASIAKQNLQFIDILDSSNISSLSPFELTRSLLAMQACYRCLIYLGDLERYRQFGMEENTRKWEKAGNYYKLALQLLPNNGNPHNQLAIIAANTQNSVVTAYRYLRALCLEQPFETSFGNLVLLFETNNKELLSTYDEYSESVIDYVKLGVSLEEIDLKCAYTWLVRLLGLVFETFNRHKSKKDFDSDLFICLANVILSRLNTQLFKPMVDFALAKGGAVSTSPEFEKFIVWVSDISISFMSILYMLSLDLTPETLLKSSSYCLVSSFLFEFQMLVLKSFSRLNQSLLPVVTVFMIWLSRQPTLPQLNYNGEVKFNSFANSPKESILTDSYSSFWFALINMVNQLSNIDCTNANLCPSNSPEEIELKGISFLPDLYNILTGGSININSFERKRKEKTSGSSTSNLTSEQFQIRRLLAIRKCIERLKSNYSNLHYDINSKFYSLAVIDDTESIQPHSFDSQATTAYPSYDSIDAYCDESAETYPPRSSLKFFDDGSIQTGVSLSSTPLDDFQDDQEMMHHMQPITCTITQQKSIQISEDDDLDDADEIDFQPRSSLNSQPPSAQLNKSMNDSDITISPQTIRQDISVSGNIPTHNNAVGFQPFKQSTLNNSNSWDNNLSSSSLILHQPSPIPSSHIVPSTNYNQFSLLQPEDYSSAFKIPNINQDARASPLLVNLPNQNLNLLPTRQSPNIMIQQLTDRVKQQEMDISNQLTFLLEDSNKIPINMNLQYANNPVPNPVHFASPFMMPYGATNYNAPIYSTYGNQYPPTIGNNLQQQQQRQ